MLTLIFLGIREEGITQNKTIAYSMKGSNFLVQEIFIKLLKHK